MSGSEVTEVHGYRADLESFVDTWRDVVLLNSLVWQQCYVIIVYIVLACISMASVVMAYIIMAVHLWPMYVCMAYTIMDCVGAACIITTVEAFWDAS